MLPPIRLSVKMSEEGWSRQTGKVPKTGWLTGFRRFDFRDEFLGLRCRGISGLDRFRGLRPEKRTFCGLSPIVRYGVRCLCLLRCSAFGAGILPSPVSAGIRTSPQIHASLLCQASEKYAPGIGGQLISSIAERPVETTTTNYRLATTDAVPFGVPRNAVFAVHREMRSRPHSAMQSVIGEQSPSW